MVELNGEHVRVREALEISLCDCQAEIKAVEDSRWVIIRRCAEIHRSIESQQADLTALEDRLLANGRVLTDKYERLLAIKDSMRYQDVIKSEATLDETT